MSSESSERRESQHTVDVPIDILLQGGNSLRDWMTMYGTRIRANLQFFQPSKEKVRAARGRKESVYPVQYSVLGIWSEKDDVRP